MMDNFLKQSEVASRFRIECPQGFTQFQDSCVANVIPPGMPRVERVKGWPRLAPRWVDQQKIIQFLETGEEWRLPPAFFPEGER